MATQEKRPRSIFDLPSNFFDSAHIVPSLNPLPLQTLTISTPSNDNNDDNDSSSSSSIHTGLEDAVLSRWTCNTCKAEFDSLLDQRAHFKSDLHRINVKLSIAGRDIVKEDEVDELTSDSFRDYEISSISGSEDEADNGKDVMKRGNENVNRKIFIHLQTGERVSVWKSLILNDSKDIEDNCDKIGLLDDNSISGCVKENEGITKLKDLIHEARDNTHLRVVLLASGGHFAGCVFDGNKVVAHKTFHRYVVRGKAGGKQSLKDATGRAIHSAGASLRRYNELALKKDVQELFAAWKPYFDAATSVFVYAPSNNRELLFNGDKPYFSHQNCSVQTIPLTVRRPTFKEAKRVYNHLTQVFYERDELNIISSGSKSDSPSESIEMNNEPIEIGDKLGSREMKETCSCSKNSDKSVSSDDDNNLGIGKATPLHEASKSGNAIAVLELLEQGLDPCAKDERGRTPYMLANEKEVRNTFRRFMASNIDKWDWHAAKVPSALTKEMEESQAAKQAEKDAKKKARAKELKKLRKAKEKKVQAQNIASQNVIGASGTISNPVKGQSRSSGVAQISKEEEMKRAQAAEREKRAAAAERRIAAAAALKAQGNSITTASSSSQPTCGLGGDLNCSYCGDSLAGKVPFHRYNYKYCSSTCMHVHREILEDGNL